MAGCGSSAAVARRFNNHSLRGTLGYIVATALTALDYRFPQVDIALDGSSADRATLNLLFICNGEYCGGGMHVGKGARLDDGLLHVVEAGGVSRLGAMLQWPSLYRGTLYGVRGVRVDAARSVTITGERGVLVDCDGELAGRLPATYRMIPAALDVCVPSHQ
jgi:diacylglycerol kinase family enzyme